MARTAQLNGELISTVTVAEGVAAYHLTKGDADGDIRVTPEVFGKIRNTDGFVIPAIVIKSLKSDK